MKKVETKNAEKAVKKPETKAAPAKKIEPKVEAQKGPERPKLPADFCLDKKDWESNNVCFDPTSNNCKTCKKDFPKTQEACSARADYLAALGKVAKAKKVTGERKVKEGGVAPQTKIIDDGLLAKKPKETIIAEVAKLHYGGDNEAGRSLAAKRFERHLKSIKDGSYVRASVVASVISYLEKDKPASKK